MFFILKTLFVHYEKMFEFSSVCRLLMKSLNKRPENNFNVVIFRANRHKEREWEGWEQMLPLLLWFWNCESQNFISRDRRRFPNNFQSIWMSNIAQIQNLIAIFTVDIISQTLPKCDVTIWIDMITSTCYEITVTQHNEHNHRNSSILPSFIHWNPLACRTQIRNKNLILTRMRRDH